VGLEQKDNLPNSTSAVADTDSEQTILVQGSVSDRQDLIDARFDTEPTEEGGEKIEDMVLSDEAGPVRSYLKRMGYTVDSGTLFRADPSGLILSYCMNNYGENQANCLDSLILRLAYKSGLTGPQRIGGQVLSLPTYFLSMHAVSVVFQITLLMNLGTRSQELKKEITDEPNFCFGD